MWGRLSTCGRLLIGPAGSNRNAGDPLCAPRARATSYNVNVVAASFWLRSLRAFRQFTRGMKSD